MTRSLAIVLATVGVLAVALLTALAWLTFQTLELERTETESRREAALESRVRLALWRMDSALTPFLSVESSRPAEGYTRTSRVRWKGNAALQKFLTLVRGHFELTPGESPREETAGRAARATPESPAAGLSFREEVAALDTSVLLEKLEAAPATAQDALARLGPEESPEPPGDLQKSPNDTFELSQRAMNLQTQMALFEPEVALESVLQPLWHGDDLLLVRRIRWDGEIRLQGSWLDREALESWLLAQIEDLLPGAALRPLDPETPRDEALPEGALPGERLPDRMAPTPVTPGRRLALLPYTLDPGPLPRGSVATGSTVQTTLGLAWVAALVTLVAVGILLGGALQLSARRAAFVSAVTHELRTPLTTFRLYTEMLAGGMVPDEERPEYLETLHREAERLSHLVGNVLAFSRLERGARPERESLTASELIARIEPALRSRVEPEGRELRVRIEPDAEDARTVTDPDAVERILFNLVDNACKYGRPEGAEGDLGVLLEAQRRGRRLVLRVRDRGPGIRPREAKRIFRPFHRSARRAAGGVPGVGLGLALSRRLARHLGGELRWVPSEEGAVFELELVVGGLELLTVKGTKVGPLG